MAHGYLAAQFFNARANARGDEYGPGSPLRFGLEVLEAIRAEVGRDIAVGVRLAASERDPDGDGSARCAEIAADIARTGLVDFVSLALGHSASLSRVGVDRSAAARGRGRDRRGSAGPRRARGRAGDRHDPRRRPRPRGADRGVGRRAGGGDDPGADRGPRAGRQGRSTGRRGETIACIGCNQACIGHYHQGAPIGCVVNPRTGREAHVARTVQRPPRRVLVIGGGPAGVAAAVEAARAGDAVTLAERGADIGGQLRLAGDAPGHAEVWRRYRGRRLARAGGRGSRCAARDGGRRGRSRSADAGEVDPRHRRPAVRAAVRHGERGGGRRRVGGDRGPGRGRRPRARRGLGRRLGRARRRRGAGRRRPPRHPGVRRRDARRDAAPVPAQRLPRPPRPRRGDRAAITSSGPATSSVTRSRRASSRCPRVRPPSSSRTGDSPRTACGPRSRAGPGSCASATCSARARSRRPSSRASSPADPEPAAQAAR